jgi:hypothetical protein
MSKLTLLQLTQSILSALNSDQVNSISDTVESLQVAECVKTSYLNMLGRYDLPEHNQLFSLNSSDDPTKPTLMMKPDGVNRIEYIKYFDSNPFDSNSLQTSQFGAYSHDLNLDLVPQNPWNTTSTTSNTIGTGSKSFVVASNTISVSIGQGVQAFFNSTNVLTGTVIAWNPTTFTLVINVTSFAGSGTYTVWNITGSGGVSVAPGYRDVDLLDPMDFITMVSLFNLTDNNVGTYTLTVNELETGLPGSFKINYKNDRTPRFYCILSNLYILFDSYDVTQDTTLQTSKTLAYGWVMPAFQMVDGFIPNLDEQQFPMLLNMAKDLAFIELKEKSHPQADREVNRQLASLQKFKALGNRPSPFEQLPSFGRRIGTGGYAVGYPQRAHGWY